MITPIVGHSWLLFCVGILFMVLLIIKKFKFKIKFIDATIKIFKYGIFVFIIFVWLWTNITQSIKYYEFRNKIIILFCFQTLSLCAMAIVFANCVKDKREASFIVSIGKMYKLLLLSILFVIFILAIIPVVIAGM